MIRIVRLGSPRSRDEGLRIGTARRPPRGVPKAEFAKRDFYDVWLPNLAPSEELLKLGQHFLRGTGTDAQWKSFSRRYLKEMSAPENARLLDTFAALSHHANFAMGCYCQDEARCHRSLLRNLLADRRAALA